MIFFMVEFSLYLGLFFNLYFIISTILFCGLYAKERIPVIEMGYFFLGSLLKIKRKNIVFKFGYAPLGSYIKPLPIFEEKERFINESLLLTIPSLLIMMIGCLLLPYGLNQLSNIQEDLIQLVNYAIWRINFNELVITLKHYTQAHHVIGLILLIAGFCNIIGFLINKIPFHEKSGTKFGCITSLIFLPYFLLIIRLLFSLPITKVFYPIAALYIFGLIGFFILVGILPYFNKNAATKTKDILPETA
jgi:hypothetical protein